MRDLMRLQQRHQNATNDHNFKMLFVIGKEGELNCSDGLEFISLTIRYVKSDNIFTEFCPVCADIRHNFELKILYMVIKASVLIKSIHSKGVYIPSCH